MFNYNNKIFRNTEIKITGIQKNKIKEIQKVRLQKYRNINYRNPGIQITGIQKYKHQKCRNINYEITELELKIMGEYDLCVNLNYR